MTADIKDQVREAQNRFKRLSLEVRGKAGAALVKAALLVERDVKKSFPSTPGTGKEHVPSMPGEPPSVDTGRLRASITHRLEKAEDGMPVALVGTNVIYAATHEFGDTARNIPPRPFLSPALERNRDEIVALIAEAVKDASKEATE